MATETPPKPGEQQTQTPPPEPPPGRAIDDPILAALGDDLVQMVNANKKPEEPPKAPEIKPAPEPPPPEPPKPQTPPAPPAQVRVRRRETAEDIANVVVTKLSEKREEKTTPLPGAAPQPEYDESQLSAEQKEELADARFSEKKGNKGRATELIKFYKSVDEYVAEHKNDEGRTFDETDDEFVQFIRKNKPGWAEKEGEVIRRERLKAEMKEEARAEVRQELEPKIESAQQEAREAKYSPIIEKRVDAFRAEFDAEAKTDDPLEKEIYETFKGAAEELVTDYLRLVNKVDTFGGHNPADKQARQQWVADFITQQAATFAEHGGDNRVRDGKTFVTPAELAKMQKDKDPKLSTVWSFRPDEYVTMIKTHALGIAKEQIKQEEETAKRRGFVKVKPESTTKPQEDPKPMSGPKAQATAAPGAVQLAGDQNLDHPGKELIAVLNLKG
jgi:hypothetical protein